MHQAIDMERFVETSTATTGLESRVEADGPSTCPAPKRSYVLANQQPPVQAHLLGVNVAK